MISIYAFCFALFYGFVATATSDFNFRESESTTLSTTLAALQANSVNNPDFERITTLIRGMRANELLREAGPRLEVVLSERESICTNRAAYAMMRNFFEKHPVSNFKVLHTGGGTSAYLVGIYRDMTGKTFKVRIFLGLNAGNWEITRIVFR
ncbi:MAG: DUF4783 domain-containing protein [Sphingomonadales bacterium]|nr:DUF4783 domain-containing protein [Sphingomonadales bacterium]